MFGAVHQLMASAVAKNFTIGIDFVHDKFKADKCLDHRINDRLQEFCIFQYHLIAEG